MGVWQSHVLAIISVKDQASSSPPANLAVALVQEGKHAPQARLRSVRCEFLRNSSKDGKPRHGF